MNASATTSTDMTAYLDSAGAYGRWTREEEHEAATALVEARRQCWDAALRVRSRVRKLLSTEIDEALWGAGADRAALLAALDAADPERETLRRLLEARSLGHRTRQNIERAQARYLRLRNRFVCHNLRLVVSIAGRLGRFHMSLADRVQEGNFGLLKAIDRFDPERGTRFSTYAGWWIRHTVTRALMNHGRTVRVPGHLHVAFTKVRRVRPALAAQLGRAPTDQELSEHTGVPVERVSAAVQAMEARAVTLDSPQGEQRTLGDMLADPRVEEWTDRVEESVDVPLATKALEVLDAKARRILQHRYGLEGAETKTLRELGADYGVSRERIRQLQVRATQRLRTEMERSAVPSVAL
ncbi:MAG: RNA polymerase sigma factor RpoD/SigA [Nannocystaceae bacterium]|nr:RNA polymerase sigma factor RpoD/SigA [bacterium]